MQRSQVVGRRAGTAQGHGNSAGYAGVDGGSDAAGQGACCQHVARLRIGQHHGGAAVGLGRAEGGAVQPGQADVSVDHRHASAVFNVNSLEAGACGGGVVGIQVQHAAYSDCTDDGVGGSVSVVVKDTACSAGGGVVGDVPTGGVGESVLNHRAGLAVLADRAVGTDETTHYRHHQVAYTGHRIGNHSGLQGGDRLDQSGLGTVNVGNGDTDVSYKRLAVVGTHQGPVHVDLAAVGTAAHLHAGGACCGAEVDDVARRRTGDGGHQINVNGNAAYGCGAHVDIGGSVAVKRAEQVCANAEYRCSSGVDAERSHQPLVLCLATNVQDHIGLNPARAGL